MNTAFFIGFVVLILLVVAGLIFATWKTRPSRFHDGNTHLGQVRASPATRASMSASNASVSAVVPPSVSSPTKAASSAVAEEEEEEKPYAEPPTQWSPLYPYWRQLSFKLPPAQANVMWDGLIRLTPFSVQLMDGDIETANETYITATLISPPTRLNYGIGKGQEAIEEAENGRAPF